MTKIRLTQLGALALLLVALTAYEARAQADLPIVRPATACAGLLGTDLSDIGGEGSRVAEARTVARLSR